MIFLANASLYIESFPSGCSRNLERGGQGLVTGLWRSAQVISFQWIILA